MSKFNILSSYKETLKSGYNLLPFRFLPLELNKYVLTNEVGEYYILSRVELDDFINHRLDFNTGIYEDLKSKHFLYDTDSNVAIDLLALKQRTKLNPLSQFTGLHIFVVSLRCEHSCPYCQVSRQSNDKEAYDMTEELAEKALQMVFRSPSDAVKIEFQGGESFLNFELMKFIVKRANEINLTFNKAIQFVAATNLAIVTDEMLEFCRDNNVFISSSLDGPKALHNKNRPRPGADSYERTIDGINRARAIVGKDNVSTLMTTTKASLPMVREIIDEYIEQGFNGIFLRPLSPYGFAIKTKSFKAYDSDEWLDFYFEGLDYILELNKSGFFFVEQYAALILTKMLTPFSTGYVDLMSPAGIGIGAVVYNYNGEIYASDEGRMLAEMKDKTFCIGNLHTDTYEDVFTSEKLLSPLEESYTNSVPMCSDCAFESFCGADPVFHYATQGDFVGHKPTSQFCKKNMTIIKKMIHLMESDPQVKEIFFRWVNI